MHGHRLIVTRGANQTRPATLYRIRQTRYFYIDTARPGTYRTACDKGYGPDIGRCRYHKVHLTKNSLMFGYREASDAVALWTGKRFEVVWLTD